MEETIADRAVDSLMGVMYFYHDNLVMVEKKEVYGFREAQFRLLHQLHTNPMQSMTSLGRRLFISKPYMTTLVDSLEDEGLARRHPDPADRRVIKICVTPKGEERLRSVKLLIRIQLKNLMSSLTEEELRDLCDCGKKFVDIVSRIR